MDRGNTKQEIWEALLEMFSLQGFEATSISRIASAAGIRQASLYSHFEISRVWKILVIELFRNPELAKL